MSKRERRAISAPSHRLFELKENYRDLCDYGLITLKFWSFHTKKGIVLGSAVNSSKICTMKGTLSLMNLYSST